MEDEDGIVKFVQALHPGKLETRRTWVLAGEANPPGWTGRLFLFSARFVARSFWVSRDVGYKVSISSIHLRRHNVCLKDPMP